MLMVIKQMDNIEFRSQETGRIDVVISHQMTDRSRSEIQKLLESGNVSCNGIVVSKSKKVKIDDLIHIVITACAELKVEAENIPLDIRYEDDDLLVVNKTKGMVVHPAPGNYSGTLVNALLYHCKDSLSGINGVIRPGIVHRIDKETSGLLIVAKNDFSHRDLALQIKRHSFTRGYKAIVYGHFKQKEGTVDAPLARSPNDRKKMAVVYSERSRKAVTHYKVLDEMNGFSLLELHLETGRTHQIRVHMAYINHPVAGDKVYGPKNVIKELNGQCLHAYQIGFIHPRTQEYIELESELPEYFMKFYKKIQYNSDQN
jgi:23S rRNA pseudouridine1911/1915/1917 synthase